MMKKRYFFYPLSLLFRTLVLNLLLSSWVTNYEKPQAVVFNEIGFPFKWLTIYSNEEGRGVISLLFGENLGTITHIIGLIYNVLFCFAVVIIFEFSYQLLKKRKKTNKIPSSAE